MDYSNKVHLAFDEPLEYKNILLYPATLPYYSIFACADDYLDISRLEEKDIRLLRLPYLTYMYEKSLMSEEFKNKWEMLINILRIVFGEEQPFDILRRDGVIFIKVYQRSGNYELLEKQKEIITNNYLQDSISDNQTKKGVEEIAKKIKEIEDKMWSSVIIDSSDFEIIRKLIMEQNDIKSQHYDIKTESFLNEMKQKLKQIKSNDETDLEDLITAVAYCSGKTNKEMSKMTIRRFNRYLQITLNKDDYYMYKQLELCGMIKMKSELSHWLKHYKPIGKFDDVLSTNSEMSSLMNGGKI